MFLGIEQLLYVISRLYYKRSSALLKRYQMICVGLVGNTTTNMKWIDENSLT